ncbi:MAG: hypothetical protein AAF430_04750 [Myxococcota bacterium]
MQRQVRALGALVLAASVLGGCANLVHGKTQRITIDSEPRGALVIVHPYGRTLKTPAETELERWRDYWVEFRLEGYETTTVVLRKIDNGTTAWNWWAGGVLLSWVGFMIDADSGARYSFVPGDLFVTLVPEQEAAASEADGTPSIEEKPDEPGK